VGSAGSRASASTADAGAPLLLGLGANLGDPAAQLREAVRRLEEELGPGRRSSLYRSAPVGRLDQPDFLNLAVRFDRAARPEEVLALIGRIEREMGRVRSVRDAPRTVDIDILGAGERVLAGAALRIPHPRLHQRAFVLLPLIEIAPEWRHPEVGMTPGEMLDRAGPLERIERLGELEVDG
jgi:2-amino-4-hydroxy-6-hydroxymethyldihydropteridine diphosphokinase